MAANDLQCDCALVRDVDLLEKIAQDNHSWLAPSNVANWRQLACSRPDMTTRRRYTVAEFIDIANCTAERRSSPSNGSTQRDHVTLGDVAVISHRHRSVDQQRRKQKPEVAAGSVEVGHAHSTPKYLPSDIRLSRHFSSSGGSAALIALALCAAMLALLGGLLLCRAGVRRSRGGGRIRRCRQKRDLFIVYADDDECWVTGTLLDVIFARHPCYDVILQQHLQRTCSDSDLKWNSHEQMVFGSVIDHSTVPHHSTQTHMPFSWV